MEIRIRSVDVRLPIAGQSFVPNRGLLPDDFPIGKDRVLWLDLKKKTTEYAPGVVVPLRPFWGVIAVAPPPSMGRVPSGPPGPFGGNMDNRDWFREPRFICRFSLPAHCYPSVMVMPPKVMAKSACPHLRLR